MDSGGEEEERREERKEDDLRKEECCCLTLLRRRSREAWRFCKGRDEHWGFEGSDKLQLEWSAVCYPILSTCSGPSSNFLTSLMLVIFVNTMRTASMCMLIRGWVDSNADKQQQHYCKDILCHYRKRQCCDIYLMSAQAQARVDFSFGIQQRTISNTRF